MRKYVIPGAFMLPFFLLFLQFLTEFTRYIPGSEISLLTPPLNWSGDRFMDFFNTNYWAIRPGRYTIWASIHPPFAFLVSCFYTAVALFDYRKISVIPRSTVLGIFSLCLFFSIFLFRLMFVGKHIKQKLDTIFPEKKTNWLLILSMLLFNVGVIYAFDRANYVIMSFVFLTFYLFSENKESFWPRLSFAAAISMKPYLILLLLMYLNKDSWKEGKKIFLMIFLLNVIALLVIHDINFYLIFENSTKYFSFSSIAEKLYSSLSILNIPILILHQFYALDSTVIKAVATTVFPFLLIIVSIFLLWLGNWKIDHQSKIFLGLILCVMIPMASFLYNAILFLPFIPMLIERLKIKYTMWTLVFLILGISSFNFFTLTSSVQNSTNFILKVSEQSLLSPLFFLMMFVFYLLSLSSEQRVKSIS